MVMGMIYNIFCGDVTLETPDKGRFCSINAVLQLVVMLENVTETFEPAVSMPDAGLG